MGVPIAAPAGRAWPPCALRGHPRPSAPPPRFTGSTPGTSPPTARPRSPSDGQCHRGLRLPPHAAVAVIGGSPPEESITGLTPAATPSFLAPGMGTFRTLHHRGGTRDSSGQQVPPEEAEPGTHWQSPALLRGWGPVLDRLGTEPAGAR